MSILTDALAAEVIEAVRAAGSLLTGDGAVHEIRSKSARDFVTDVDMRVQETLRARLGELAPEAQFMGEEQDNSFIDPARPFWILDPVDGTTNLIRRLGHSAVSLALAEDGGLALGVVFNPFAGELFSARRGGGAFLNGRPIHVSAVGSLPQALVSIGTAPGRRDLSALVFREMLSFYDRCLDLRRSGCASLDLCDVALGRTEIYIERFLHPWDYAAGALIVAEAGGKVTDCGGAALPLTHSSGVAASNGVLHRDALALLERSE